MRHPFAFAAAVGAGQPEAIQASTSALRQRVLPPSLIGATTFLALTSRHKVRVETSSIPATSDAVIRSGGVAIDTPPVAVPFDSIAISSPCADLYGSLPGEIVFAG
jgi:hypothetical protein